jgi:glucokinase
MVSGMAWLVHHRTPAAYMGKAEEDIAIGIDLGGSHVAVAAVDRKGKIIHNYSIDIVDHGVDAVIETVVKATRHVLGDVKGEIAGVGIGSPGNINTANGSIRYSPNFGWHDVPLGERLRDRLKLEVFVANDARCATLGEYTFGIGKGTSDFVLLTLGTGIGGGIIAGGRLQLGNGMAAGEVGHHQIRPTDGFVCGCGKIGCFEAQAAGMGLIRHAKALESSFPKSMLLDGKPDQLGSKGIRKAAEAGDGHGRAAWNNYIADLAIGVANVIAMLNPEIIALGGGVSSAGEYLLAALSPKVDALTTMAPPQSTRLTIATLGNDAGMIGAAVMAFQGGLLEESSK